MGISPKLLSPGERVIVSTRTHWKALIFPALVFIVTAAVTGFVIGLLPDGWTWLLIVVLTFSLAIVLVWTVRPFVMWLSASYTLTDRGRGLGVVVAALATWGRALVGPRSGPRHAACGHPIEIQHRASGL